MHKNHVTLQNGEGPAGILSGGEKTVCWGGWWEVVDGECTWGLWPPTNIIEISYRRIDMNSTIRR